MRSLSRVRGLERSGLVGALATSAPLASPTPKMPGAMTGGQASLYLACTDTGTQDFSIKPRTPLLLVQPQDPEHRLMILQGTGGMLACHC